jgi:hypothetical protein
VNRARAGSQNEREKPLVLLGCLEKIPIFAPPMTCLDSIESLLKLEKKRLLETKTRTNCFSLTPKSIELDRFEVGTVPSIYYYPNWLSQGGSFCFFASS